MQPVALVTGGEGDIARPIREKLLAAGWQVFSPGKKDLDVTKPEACEAWLRKLPRLDYLINTAGILRDNALSKIKEEDWNAVIATNLDGAFHIARLTWNIHMRKQRSGHILFIGSGSARYGVAGQASYAASKAGVLGLMQSLAREYGSADVRVNLLLPGFIPTKMTAHLNPPPDANVLGRFNTAEAVARFVVFLDSLPHTSGQVFQLDSRIGREL